MMELGIFTRTFPGALDEALAAIVSHRMSCAHLSFASLGIRGLPDELDETLCRTVREAFDRRGVRLAAVSATFNAIHPDRTLRQREIRRAQRIIQGCRVLGTKVVTLCSGTRDSNDMWRGHPDNAKPEAWTELRGTLDRLLPLAEAHGVVLGIEPERANVIDSAVKARRLLDEVKSRQLRIIFDGANLFDPGDLSDMTAVLQEAFELLGPDIEMVHAKDITGNEAKRDQAAGTGKLDWPTYFRLMKNSGFDGPLMLHNLKPSQVAGSIQFVCHEAAPWYPEPKRWGAVE